MRKKAEKQARIYQTAVAVAGLSLWLASVIFLFTSHSLREQLVVDVLERRSVPGNDEWVHVRTTEGLDGWVIGLVALPLTPSNR